MPTHSPETREKIRQSKLGKPRKFSNNPEKTKALMSAAKKRDQADGGYFKGRHHSAETRRKMSESQRARLAGRRRDKLFTQLAALASS
ncbi:MAG: NUMOD3 domain-containing DNA-binding protein [Candidatus Nanopelagicales bacterium]